jgi:hypothetical protein
MYRHDRALRALDELHLGACWWRASSATPGINMPYNPPYYDRLLTRVRLHKAKDLLHWELDPQKPTPERIVRVAEKMAARSGVKLRKMSFDDWDAEVLRTLEIYNDAWEKNWGFVPIGKKEYFAYRQGPQDGPAPRLRAARRGRRQAGRVRVDDPERQPGDEEARRQAVPVRHRSPAVGLKVKKTIKAGRLILLGIKAQYRGQGIDSLLFLATHRAAPSTGWTSGEIGLDARRQLQGQQRDQEHGRVSGRHVSRLRRRAVSGPGARYVRTGPRARPHAGAAKRPTRPAARGGRVIQGRRSFPGGRAVASRISLV